MAGSTSLGGLVDGGQAEFLNVWTAQRLRRWPNVPTLHDLGYNKTVTTPFGIMAPARLDPAITRILHDAFAVAMKDDHLQAMLERYDMVSEYREQCHLCRLPA